MEEWGADGVWMCGCVGVGIGGRACCLLSVFIRVHLWLHPVRAGVLQEGGLAIPEQRWPARRRLGCAGRPTGEPLVAATCGLAQQEVALQPSDQPTRRRCARRRAETRCVDRHYVAVPSAAEPPAARPRAAHPPQHPTPAGSTMEPTEHARRQLARESTRIDANEGRRGGTRTQMRDA